MPPTEEIPNLPAMPVRRPNWAQLAASYVQVSATVKYWQGRSKLQLEDLGYDPESEFGEFAETYLRLGSQFLIPPRYTKALASIRERARQCFREHGMASPWKVGAHLIRRASYLRWREAHHALEVEFLAAKTAILEEYEQWGNEVVEAHRHRIKQALATERGFDVDIIEEHLRPGELDLCVNTFRATIPTVPDIEAKFVWTWYPELLEAPEAVTAGLSLGEVSERQRQAEQAVHAAEERLRALQGQEGEENERLRLSVEEERIRLETERQIWADAQERAAAARVQELDDLCAQVSAQIRELVASTAQGIMDGLGKREHLHGPQANTLREMVAQLRELNIANDPEVERVAAEVAALNVGTDQQASPEEMQAAMQEISAWARAGLYVMGRTDRFSSAESRRKGQLEPITADDVAPAIERFRRPRMAQPPSRALSPEQLDIQRTMGEQIADRQYFEEVRNGLFENDGLPPETLGELALVQGDGLTETERETAISVVPDGYVLIHGELVEDPFWDGPPPPPAESVTPIEVRPDPAPSFPEPLNSELEGGLPPTPVRRRRRNV